MLSTDFAVSMPSVEMIECDKVACINVMKEYLQKLKNMEHSQAKKFHLKILTKNCIQKKK